MSDRGRLCSVCGAPVVLGPIGYTHANGPDKHVPIPVRCLGAGTPMFDNVSHGSKRPSGDAAHFTAGDGRGRGRR